ncbi:hypothetical protein JAAARDRAFT_28611 [Jaapia argillacea MUCL 33604]|uniref:Single-stranded DNA-binding protein n=1 Tax=Jaapia argillacea MUCL 33604 TaxID=933084 RepID=A0A067QFN4_9AGAM|nr:hypothetical protein JAAARDRAFT_28611 [Jaapia argillacea MUCL 33604]
MMSAARFATAPRAASRAFSTSASRSSDLAKLVLIGRLGKDPELRRTKTDKEYVSYTVATTNYPPPPPGPDGARPEPKTSWHTVTSFHPGVNNYLQNLRKGSHVYVEANYEMRDLEPEGDATHGQKHVFLRHEMIRVLKGPPSHAGEEGAEH